ncbi:MAG TPA: glutamate--tRNA ligase [Geminicoccaceae bacterium]|nr:glutamate--tRNA ligase [Geminicoccaceae bacterium]
MSVVTRFAPSPTGFLHIGGARTALFNWLFARHHGGRYLLRIEDTDRERSTKEAIDAIFDGLGWLGLLGDGEPVFQSARLSRHAEVARELLERGRAYRCYATPEELAEMRELARAEGRSVRYDGRWRDRDPSEAPPGVEPVIRLRAPQEGETVVDDLVQGEVRFANTQLDDMVLLRSDGTPTYMLSVVVDDHDMAISHVIRGDDHLNNAARQTQLYLALGWEVPRFAHVPLIHGPDGAKLSKRHGALGVEAYREMGFLPEAMRNYLLRLGWAHGDDEIIPTERAIAWFDIDAVGRSPARFDLQRLSSLNAHYLRQRGDAELAAMVAERLAAEGFAVDAAKRRRLEAAVGELKERAKTLVDLAESARFLVAPRPIALNPQAAGLLNEDARRRLAGLAPVLDGVEPWEPAALEAAVRGHAEEEGLGLGRLAQPLRAALTGSTASPGIFEVMAALGRDEVRARVADAVEGRNQRAPE